MDYKKYYEKLINENNIRSKEFPKNKIFSHSRDTNYYTNPFTYENFKYNFVISNPRRSRVFGQNFEGLIVELLLDDKIFSNSFFNQLKQFKVEIESELECQLFWRDIQKKDKSHRCRIYTRLAVNIENTKNWDTYITWQLNTMIKFLKVFPKYTKELKKSINYISYPDDLVENDDVDLIEGAKKQVVVNAYERNSKARQKCIECHGTKCFICNFDFEKIYGEIGKDFIHVHHIKPLSEIKENYIIEPTKDLIPVCPNCHAMLHRKNPAIKIDDLKKLINKPI